MVSSILVKICIVLIVTIVSRIDAVTIPGTDLLTDTNYQISDPRLSGFNILTYASVYTQGGETFVQLDDHADREQKYAAGGPWFQDGLWTLKFINQVVTIHHVLYPGYKLVMDGVVESPTNVATPNHYLILSNSGKYNYTQEYYQNGLWEITQKIGEPGIYSLKNTGRNRFPAPLRFYGEYYKWLNERDQEYTYRIKAV